jgi:hypothetical protein
MPANLAESIRNALHAVVSQNGIASDTAAMTESTLIRNGSYCGRRFSLLGFSVVWFQEEGQIKLYNPSGTLEQSCPVLQFCRENSAMPTAHESRRAA